jgi:hypothetical protein
MKSSDMIEELRSELHQDLYFIRLNYDKNREMNQQPPAEQVVCG